MRILLTADPGLPVPPRLYGGIERIIAGLAGELQRRGHNVGLLADTSSTCATEQLFSWPQVPPTKVNLLRFAATLRRAVAKFQPDVLHSFSRLLFMSAVLPLRGVPKVMSYQRAPTKQTVRWANRLARGSLTFTGCSEHISREGRRAGGTWQAIHNFVDVNHFTFESSVASDAPLVFLSRVESIKGAHVAIEACRRAGRKLVIAGNHSEKDDSDGRYWCDLIQPHLEDDGIEYVGPVNDEQKNELLGKAAAMIVPIEWNEPFGIVFAEALACGTPVISCPRGALPEIVREAVDGFLVESLDDAVAAIGKLGGLDRAACRSRAEEKFSVEAVVPKYEKLYAECVIERTTR